ncbi:hypothetical protein LTR47_008631 [Exophiala xenobiotica]|nr:hypothetical protein LTR92_000739 [Exophiala xenobiotica]KAK5204052.1 hypothetical protein LTR41_010263 [Exophiala xenobiotica]KAK5227589.1 hypothetical protein LTR47_008631 [Exophiala xenobiotica]KAK5249733.1 hypothetical protein LTS06_005367 [Exophiala xenobiotica]KAK5282373.1 hypothetical protein LTR40_003403 [Exophiala xenobiotica]
MASEEPNATVSLATDFDRRTENKKGPQSTIRRTALPVTHNAWLWELLSLVLAVASLVIVCVILRTADHHPFHGLPLQIKLTTALSILANAIEALVAVPLAAGLGQIMWIRYHQKHRALNDITMFDRASRGPLGEFSILFQRHKSMKAYFGAMVGLLTVGIGPFLQETIDYVNVDGKASLLRCESTSFLMGQGMYNTFHGIIESAKSPMGGIADQNLQELNTDCSTGKCTFPIFSSLGICSSCGNITGLLAETCGTDADTGTICTATFKDDNTDIWIDNHTVMNSIGYEYNGIPRLDAYGDSGIAAFRMLRYDYAHVAHATECAFFYCVRAYQSAVQNVVLQQNVTTTWFGTKSLVNDRLVDRLVFSPPRSTWESLNLTEPTNFTIDSYTYEQVPQWIAGELDGTVEEFGGTTTTNKVMILSGICSTTWLHRALTRTLGCPTNISAVGTIFDIATVLEVQWRWLAFPALVITLTGAFLLWVMLDTQRNRAMVWKNRVLPLIFCGRSAEIDEFANEKDLEDVDAMELYAKKLNVKLERDDRGIWHFETSQRWNSEGGVESYSMSESVIPVRIAGSIKSSMHTDDGGVP